MNILENIDGPDENELAEAAVETAWGGLEQAALRLTTALETSARRVLELQAQNKVLREELARSEIDRTTLKEELKFFKLALNLPESGGKEDLKRNIEGLIQEIDQCLAQLGAQTQDV